MADMAKTSPCKNNPQNFNSSDRCWFGGYFRKYALELQKEILHNLQHMTWTWQARPKHPPEKITPKTSIHLIDVDLGVIFGSMH